jgi:hypothetical protein
VDSFGSHSVDLEGVRGPASGEGYVTPRFGRHEAARLARELGMGEIVPGSGPVYPDSPVFVCTEPVSEKALTGLGGEGLDRCGSMIRRGF